MPLSPLRLRLLVGALLTTSFLGALDHTVVATSLATIAGELGGLEHMSWIVVGYTLASTVLLPVLGRLGDMLGPRVVFLVSLAGFILASLACGLAADMATLIVARVAQGMFGAGLQLLSQTILAHVTTPRQRPRHMAVIGAAFPIAILVGPVIGGAITDYWSWHWVFWINIPLGIAAFALAATAIPHIPGTGRRRFDIPGTITFTIAFVALVIGCSWVLTDQSRTEGIIAIAVTLVVGAVFFIIQLRTPEPLVPLHLFANRTISVGIGLSTIIGIGIFSITAYLPTYIQMAYRTTATVSGLVPIATVFGMLVSNLATGWMASRTGSYRLYPIIGTAVGSLGFIAMAALPAGAPLWAPMVLMGLVGLGTGSYMSLIVTVVQSAVARSETGAVTATLNLVRQVGSTVATAIIGGIVAVGVINGLPGALDPSTLTPGIVQQQTDAVQGDIATLYTDIFSTVFIALAVVCALGVIAAILLPRGTLSDETDHESEPLHPDPIDHKN